MLVKTQPEPIVPTSARIEHNYLPAQFADMDAIWAKIRRVVETGDFTLGKAVAEFEQQAASALGSQHVIGVNSGTDALILTLKALGVRGEVLVPAFTFVATIAAVQMAGARPVLVDVGDDFNIDVNKIEAAITPHTEAIIPVHWAGRACDMNTINAIAHEHGLFVLEDACHAVGASYGAKKCGVLGHAGAFSLHPLKNVNVWGDGGFITTSDTALYEKLRRWRNHGLSDRNVCQHYAHNSRLDSIQAVVASHVLEKLPYIVAVRRRNATNLHEALLNLDGFTHPNVPPHKYHTYYLYSGHATQRDLLLKYLNEHGVDAKAHYPIPMHLQPAASYLGYKRGDFPMAEYCSDSTISLPVHEFVTDKDVLYIASLVRRFYEKQP